MHMRRGLQPLFLIDDWYCGSALNAVARANYTDGKHFCKFSTGAMGCKNVGYYRKRASLPVEYHANTLHLQHFCCSCAACGQRATVKPDAPPWRVGGSDSWCVAKEALQPPDGGELCGLVPAVCAMCWHETSGGYGCCGGGGFSDVSGDGGRWLRSLKTRLCMR